MLAGAGGVTLHSDIKFALVTAASEDASSVIKIGAIVDVSEDDAGRADKTRVDF